MANVGDRIVLSSKGRPRSGVVTAVGTAMITVRWDTGGETSIVPGPGNLSVATDPVPPAAKKKSSTKRAEEQSAKAKPTKRSAKEKEKEKKATPSKRKPREKNK